VVIEGSRPRALAQLGLTPSTGRAARPQQVWTSITAYGRTGPWADRVGFGDDTAAAGGLVARTNGVPAFLGDAVADPITGALAALATMTALARGGGVTIDIALRDAACWTAGGRHPTLIRV
jgi:crotonobetainyl-CoA:carnitine CoA-transferase CaiB-like acyl-CoA transferase